MTYQPQETISMFNLFAAFNRLCNALNSLSETLESANERLQGSVGHAPLDVTPESLPAPESENGEHRKKAKTR